MANYEDRAREKILPQRRGFSGEGVLGCLMAGLIELWARECI